VTFTGVSLGAAERLTNTDPSDVQVPWLGVYLRYLLLVLFLLAKFKCPTSPLFSLSSLSPKLSLSICHLQIQRHLSYSSSCSFSLHFRVYGCSPLSVCPIHFPGLALIVLSRVLSSPIVSTTRQVYTRWWIGCNRIRNENKYQEDKGIHTQDRIRWRSLCTAAVEPYSTITLLKS